MVYAVQVCWQLASRIRTETVPSWSCWQAVSKPVRHIPLLCVQWRTRVDGTRNCPKHVEFYSKNKFEKFVHLVGFIMKIYHDTDHLNVKITSHTVDILAPCRLMTHWISVQSSVLFKTVVFDISWIYILLTSVQHDPSWKASSRTASREI